MNKILFVSLILICNLFAGVTGKLAGKITDKQTGAALPMANISIEGTKLGAAADVNGNYVILNIPPGTYRIRASFLGYETIVMEGVNITVDRTTRIDIALDPQAVQLNEVVVTAKSAMIQKDLTSSISVIDREKIESLPVSSFTDLLSLQAGVVGSGSGLHIRGGRSNEVAYLIDGMYVSDPLLGGLATSLNNDAIQEMSLLSGTFNAEYGNALSGVVNIVTREGSDKYAGKVEYRTSEFGIDRYSDLHESRMNASFEGPIVGDYLRFFTSMEQDKRGSYLPWGYNKERSAFLKLSSFAMQGLKLTLSARGTKGNSQRYDHMYKYIPDQYLKRRTNSSQSTITATHSVSPEFFYDFRFSYFDQTYYSGLDKDTSQYIPMAQRSYFDDLGNSFEFYSRSDPEEITDSRTSTLDFKFDAVWQIDKTNETKFGLQFKKHDLKLDYVYDPKRDYPYINNYDASPYEAAGYIQDKIELPYLIINLGLRFDFMNANASFRLNPLDTFSLGKAGSRYQISPRIGIAHPISEKTKLHFAYGHFFQNPEYQFLFDNQQYDLNVREPIFGQPNLDAQRTIAYEVGLAHQFNDYTALNLVAYYKDVTGLIGTRYLFPYFEGRYVGYTLYVNEDYANIRGFEINLDMRPYKNFAGGLTYTYSVAKGSASSETEQYPGTSESSQLYFLDFDKTHVFNASVTYTIPEGESPYIFGVAPLDDLDISCIVKAGSGYPYTPGGRDVGFVVKNSLRMPATYAIDLVIGKEFRIAGLSKVRLFAEVLNLTDRKNVVYVYSDTGEPDFTYVGGASTEGMRDPSNYGPPRSIRLGASVKF